MIFSRKKNKRKPQAERAHGQWTRYDFEQLKTLGSDFNVRVMHATKSVRLRSPSRGGDPLDTEYDFTCIPSSTNLGWFIHLQFVNVSPEFLLTDKPKFDPNRHVGWIDLGHGLRDSDVVEELGRDRGFTKTRGQLVYPSLMINLFTRYQSLERELFESCNNAEQSGMIEIRIILDYDWDTPICESWQEFKDNDDYHSLWLPVLSMHVSTPTSSSSEHRDFLNTQHDPLRREEFLSSWQDFYEEDEKEKQR